MISKLKARYYAIKKGQVLINSERRAQKVLCEQLGITNKQMRKRRILRNYAFKNGIYELALESSC